MYLKNLLAISFLAMSASLSALASDVVVPVDPIIEGTKCRQMDCISAAVLNLN